VSTEILNNFKSLYIVPINAEKPPYVVVFRSIFGGANRPKYEHLFLQGWVWGGAL
jgi:hypothetical protein